MTNDKVCAEVYSILNVLGENYINKLPSKTYKAIENQKDDTYYPKYDANIDINKQGISKEALSIITLFNIKYWANEEKRDLLIKIIDKNKKKITQELDKRYENIFEANKTISAEETSLIQTKQSFWNKLISKIKGLFKKG